MKKFILSFVLALTILGTSACSTTGTGSEVFTDSEIPTGLIAMWAGSKLDIPDGWIICDGQGGSPDLRDRFVVGLGVNYQPGDIGGNAEIADHVLSNDEMPNHSHSFWATPSTGDPGPVETMINFESNTYGATYTGDTGESEPHTHGDNRPPYYALAYIYKN